MIYFRLDEILTILDQMEEEIVQASTRPASSEKYTLWSKITINKIRRRIIKRAKEKYKK